MPATELDRNGLVVLSRDEALDLLGQRSVGRVAVTIRALPTILPVTYVLDRATESIVFRTGSGTKLAAAGRNAVVAFETDDLDESTRTGWSVVVIGTATEVTEPLELERIDGLGLEPWVTAATLDHTIRIPIVHISGRWIPPDGLANLRPLPSPDGGT